MVMRIKRIRCRNLTGLVGEVDWTFPEGPAVLFSEDHLCQKALAKTFQDLFYDLKTSPKINNSKGFMDMWLSWESGSFFICQEFSQSGNDFEPSVSLEIKNQNGQYVFLPDTINTLGEYFLRVKLRAFRQGVLVVWPENAASDDFLRRIRNFRQCGEEGLSLLKVRASLTGALKRVKDQSENMLLVKAEYDALRQEWEDARRRQEEERLLQIEIRKLQERENILSESINAAEKLEERLALYRQNSDYRELRQLQGELIRLEEHLLQIETAFTLLTTQSQLDWSVIEGLREECLEWAFLQDQVEKISAKVMRQTLKIQELENLLQASGYQEFSAEDIQRLRLREQERQDAQTELDNLAKAKSEFEIMQSNYNEEVSRFQSFDFDILNNEKVKIEKMEKRLAKWHNSRIASIFDHILRGKLEISTISERLSIGLIKYYQKYNVSNYTEFTNFIREFRDHELLVEKMQGELQLLQEKLSQEEYLRKIVHTHSENLNQALAKVNAGDFITFLQGWQDYRRQSSEFSQELAAKRLEEESQQSAEEKMMAAVAQLREKLENWGILATNRDEVLAEVLKAAGQLRAKDEAEREVKDFSQRLKDLLGARKIEHLAKILEPLAELEREMCISPDGRLSELAAKHNELQEIQLQLQIAEQSIQSGPKFMKLSDLESKIEKVKRQWLAYVDLQQALDDGQTILEKSGQEWQTNYGKVLDEEKQWIYKRIFSSVQEISENENLKRTYIAYRMAIAQLSLRDNSGLPLIFLVEEMNREADFWEAVTAYLQKISLARQVILVTSDTIMFHKLIKNGWNIVSMASGTLDNS